VTEQRKQATPALRVLYTRALWPDRDSVSRRVEARKVALEPRKTFGFFFKVTGSGRVRRPSGGGQHGMIGKSRRRRRRLRDNALVSPAFEHRVKFLLPYS
jgi:ribosomal protein L35